MASDVGTCPRCGRAGSMRDLGDGLAWCDDCNIGITDEDHLDEAASVTWLVNLDSRVVHHITSACKGRAWFVPWVTRTDADRACRVCGTGAPGLS